MLPMLFPHVLSTETKFETTMGFSHNNRLKSESRASGTGAFNAFGKVTFTSKSCTSEMSTLQFTNKIRLCRRVFVCQLKQRWKRQRLQQHKYLYRCIHTIPFESRHHSNNQLISTVLRINQKAERSTSRNIMPSSQIYNIRRTNNELCLSTKTVNRKPRTTCNCMSSLAMARSTLCNRTETNTVVSKRNRSCLCLLQSNALVPDMSNRYRFSSSFLTFIKICISENLWFQRSD